MNIIELCKEYKELQRLSEELSDQIDAIKEQIRAIMGGAETVTAGEYKVTDKPVTSSRLDSTALKRELPEIAARFTKTTTAKRFIIA